jgi:hypothetical protein
MVCEAKTILQRVSLVFEAYQGVLAFRCNVLMNIRVKEAEIETERERLVVRCYAFASLIYPESRQPIYKPPGAPLTIIH